MIGVRGALCGSYNYTHNSQLNAGGLGFGLFLRISVGEPLLLVAIAAQLQQLLRNLVKPRSHKGVKATGNIRVTVQGNCTSAVHVVGRVVRLGPMLGPRACNM